MTLVALPPPRFDHPYPGPLTEWIEPVYRVRRLCHDAGLRDVTNVYGCSFKIGAHCFVYRVADDSVRRHERAHCNGWSAAHEGGAFEGK